MSPNEEAAKFIEALRSDLPRAMDGRETILALQAAESNWRQMEWFGFGFEHLATNVLIARCGAERGPTFGRTQFDIRREYVWDLKAHPTSQRRLILNDLEAVDECVSAFGGIGFIVAHGMVLYDEDGTFKAWHDELKGAVSKYEIRRVERGARSRRRKTAFTISRYEAFWFASHQAIQTSIEVGHLGRFQEGMRNSDGSPRRPKYMIRNLDGLRESGTLVAECDL